MEIFTACCRQGRLLLEADEHKQIVLQSLAFLTREQRIWLYGFVILNDEFHLLWKKQQAWETKNIRQMMLKFIAQQIKQRLRSTRSPELEKYRSNRNDRQYHFWERNSRTTRVISREMAAETICQLHEAPVSTGLCIAPEEYGYSSARCYALAQPAKNKRPGNQSTVCIRRSKKEKCSWLYHISATAGILAEPPDNSLSRQLTGDQLIITDFEAAFDPAGVCR